MISKKYFKLSYILLFWVGFALAQNNNTVDVKGTVISSVEDKSLGIAKGDPIIGATVVVDGTTKGTTADIDGNFVIKGVPVGSKIKISFSGFKIATIVVDGSKTDFNISMQPDAIEIDEVPIVVYAPIKRSTQSSSNVNVSGKDIGRTINQDMGQALQGRAAGVQVTQTSGAPGAASSVNIRGTGSINGSQPLYVVDGVPLDITEGNISNFNPADVESMEILKDAAATAIYGSRGANGVVIVTTKRGKDGKGKIDFDAMVGVQSVWRKLDVLDGPQYKDYMRDSYKSANSPLNAAYTSANPDPNAPSTLNPGQANTNWIDEMLRTGSIQNYNIRASGGNANATYSIGLGYYKQAGTLKKSDYERYTFRVNSDLKPKTWLTVGESMSFTKELNTRGSDFGTAINGAMGANPLMPVYNSTYDSSLPDSEQPNAFGFSTAENQSILGTSDFLNPVAANTFTNNINNKYRIFGNVYGEIDFGNLLKVESLKGLKYKASFGVDIMQESISDQQLVFAAGLATARRLQPTIGRPENNNFSNVVTHLLSYNKTFAKKHEIAAVAGFDAQFFRQTALNPSIYGPFPPRIIELGSSNADKSGYNITSATYENGLRGYLGRINYTYDNTFMVTFNARYDGSSRFGRNFRYGFFPSVSAGWRVSNMKFMQNIKVISELKLRFGWGLTGNQEIGIFRYLQLIYTDIIRYPLGGQGANPIYFGAAPTRGLENPNLKWENVQQFNAGIDFGLYKNALMLNIDLYSKDSRDMLVPVPIPALSGATDAPVYERVQYLTNIGSILNQGIEIGLTYRNEKSDFKYSLSPNVSFIRNNVTSLSTDKPKENTIIDGNDVSYVDVNRPAAYFDGYVFDGIIQTQEEADAYVGNNTLPGGAIADVFSVKKSPGDAKFKDLNGDGKIDNSDRTQIGSPIPWMIYGFSFDASFKGFDFKLFLQGTVGNEIYNSQRRDFENMANNGGPTDKNQLISVLDRWTPANPSNTTPRAFYNDPAGNSRVSSRFVEDGSFLRLKNIQIGYTLPAKLLQKILKTEDPTSLRFYIQAQNLFTFTSYSGFDPELANYGRDQVTGRPIISSQVAGVDSGSFPQPRTYSIGLQFSF